VNGWQTRRLEIYINASLEGPKNGRNGAGETELRKYSVFPDHG
jgi:hypothetical protein